MRKGDFDIVTQALGAAQVIAIAGDLDEAPGDWLSDDRLLVMEWLANGATSIFLSGPEGSDRTPLVTGPFSKGYPRVSPDGRWLALCANPSGGYSVNVRRLEGTGGLQHLAPAEGECTVRWSAGTKELVYIRGTALVAMAYEERSGRLEVVRTTTLATLPPRSELYGVSQDGQRVLVGIPASPPPATPGIRVIVNGIGALR